MNGNVRAMKLLLTRTLRNRRKRRRANVAKRWTIPKFDLVRVQAARRMKTATWAFGIKIRSHLAEIVHLTYPESPGYTTTVRPRRYMSSYDESYLFSMRSSECWVYAYLYLKWPLRDPCIPSVRLSYNSTPRKVFGLNTKLNTQITNKCTEDMTYPSWYYGLLETDAVKSCTYVPISLTAHFLVLKGEEAEASSSTETKCSVVPKKTTI
jgi:hypothetical protein